LSGNRRKQSKKPSPTAVPGLVNIGPDHLDSKVKWEKIKDQTYWGHESVENEGFVHCSPLKYLWRVLPNFEDEEDELVIICIDEDKLEPEVKYEDGDNCGRSYPHVYGTINNDAVIMVLDYLKDKHGHYMKNPELANIIDE